LIKYDDIPSSRQRPASPWRSAEVSIMIAGISALSCVRIRSTSMKPSMSGIIASTSTSGYGRPAAAARRSSASAAVPPSTAVGFAYQRRKISSSTRRFVPLSSTTNTSSPRSNSGEFAGFGREPINGAPRRISNENVLPTPGLLSTFSRPPSSSTSRAEIVRPRPVPPKRRVVEPSACANGSKIARSLSAAMPIPVSSTEKRSR